MRYQITVWLSYANSGKDIKFLVNKGFSVYCRETNTECISATKKIENGEIHLEDEDNIYVLGETRRYECFYNGNSDLEVFEIMNYIRERTAGKISPILGYKISFAVTEDNRIFY